MKIWKNIWTVVNKEIQIPWNDSVKGGVEASKQVLELAKALKENKNAAELAPLIGNISSLLDVLNSPLVQVAGASLPFVSVATGILTFISDRTKQELTLEMCAALVSQAAYLESLRQFLQVNPQIKVKFNDTPASAAVTKQIQKLGEKLELNGNEFELSQQDAEKLLVCFHDSNLAKVFNGILKARLQESGLPGKQANIVTERVSRNTHRYMKRIVAEVKDSVPRLATIYGQGWQQDLETYLSIDQYLEEVIAQKPLEKVFDEDFCFRDVYIPLNVKLLSKGIKVETEYYFREEQKQIHQWAVDILLDESKQKQVLFIQAGPGQGKSVFCRMFADLVRNVLHPIYTPILIRLRDLKTFKDNFDETLGIAIGRDFVTKNSGWLTDYNTRFLFLLDGFDELLLERGATNELQQFLEQVALFQQRCAENSERGHRILITGRPLALYGIEKLMPTNLERVEIMPMDEKIQQNWFSKWQKIVNSDPNLAEVKTNNLKTFLQDYRCPEQVKTLAREPLLLYLLAVMHRDDQLKVEMFEDASRGGAKVLIYEQAVDWVLQKQRSESGRNLNLRIAEIEDLRTILAEAGLSVVQSGREFAAISMIESRLIEKEDEGAKEFIEKARKQDQENPLKNALAAFYLKSVPGADNSVEFFHKSFGEFLCADCMVESLEEWTAKTGKRRKTYVIPTKELAWQIYDLFGYGHLTPEIVEYLMALVEKRQIDILALFERLNDFYLRWSEGEFIEAIEDSLPQKKARQLQKLNIETGARTIDIYTGLNVLILLSELYRQSQSQNNEKESINFHPCGELNTEDFKPQRLLQIIRYSQCLGTPTFNQKIGQFFSSLNLSSADISSANLLFIDLTYANLEGANLSNSHVGFADSTIADFPPISLKGKMCTTCLADNSIESYDCSTCGAPLTPSLNANYANFSNANLSWANLRGSDLSWANLRGSDLSGANLSGANLTRISHKLN